MRWLLMVALVACTTDDKGEDPIDVPDPDTLVDTDPVDTVDTDIDPVDSDVETDEPEDTGHTGDTGVAPPPMGYRSLHLGPRSCVVRAADGKLDCWGFIGGGLGYMPIHEPVLDYDDSCAVLESTGEVVCETAGDAPVTTMTFTEVETVSARRCGVVAQSGSVWCWSGFDGTPVAELQEPVHDLQLFWNYGCARRLADEHLVCFGELPDDFTLPTGPLQSFSHGSGAYCSVDDVGSLSCSGDVVGPPPTNGPYTSVAVAGQTFCAIRQQGGVTDCWGETGAIPVGVSLEQIAAYGTVLCGLDPQGELHCWGDADERLVFGAPSTRALVDMAVAGQDDHCTIDDTRLRCTSGGDFPADVVGGWTDVDMDDRRVCAIDGATSMATCWGTGAVAPAVAIDSIELDDGVVCGTQVSDGTLSCTGASASTGQWAIGAPTEPVTGLSIAKRGACALSAAGMPLCWGRVLGRPVAVPSVAMSDVDVDGATACGVVASDGSVTCWGELPAQYQAPPAGVYSAVSVGDQNGCAIRASDQSLACWHLGGRDSVLVNRVPGGAFDAVMVRDTEIACALRVDGTRTCWGAMAMDERSP